MKNQKHIAYTAPNLTKISIETVSVLLASGGSETEEPRGALSEHYTSGARAVIDWEEFFSN